MLKTELKMTPQNAGFWQNREISRQNSFFENLAFQTALPRSFLAEVFWQRLFLEGTVSVRNILKGIRIRTVNFNSFTGFGGYSGRLAIWFCQSNFMGIQSH